MQAPRVSVVVSPALLPLYPVADSAVVVIDILRATTTMVAALANGVRQVLPVESVEDCLGLVEHIPTAISAGEQNGKIIDGFDRGNSPMEYVDGSANGKNIVMVTTNGTKLIRAAARLGSQRVFVGAFLNIDATVAAVEQTKLPVLLCCAGWKNLPNIEDMLFAGAFISQIKGDIAGCDSALIAYEYYQMYQDNIMEIVKKTTHYRRLDAYCLSQDLNFCFQKNVYAIVAEYQHLSVRVH